MGRYESYAPQKGSSEVRVFTFWLVHQEYVRYEAVQNNLARNRNLINSLPSHQELHYMRVNIYRPQRSWAKVIFSQACVKNSVHRGEGVCLSACWDTTPRDQADPPPPQTRQTPRTRQTPPDQADPHGPGRPPPRTRQTPAYGLRAAGTHPTGMHSCYCIVYIVSNTCIEMPRLLYFTKISGYL